MSYTGNEGCPCIDASEALSSLNKRSCVTNSSEEGVLLTPELSSCVPLYYGSNSCLQHDLLYSPVCQELDDATIYCLRSWCFVDRDTCKTNSSERVYRSDYFGSSFGLIFDESGGLDLFYSYTTCNSTGADWQKYKEELSPSQVLGGASFYSLSTNTKPFGYKRAANGTILDSSSPAYKDDIVPYEGVYIDYVKELIGISNGDISMVYYTHGSKAASEMHPTSTGTATIQDVSDGLVDMAVGPYWITGERLKMTAFTVPLVYDKTVLVIERPGSKTSLNEQTRKVLQPFESGLWALSLAIILVAALLSVWFTDREKREATYSKSVRRLQSNRKSGLVYARLTFDSFLQKGMFFFGASVEQEEGASLSNRILMFGYGFFILIAVSAYVANLAAFLTRQSIGYVGTMQEAVASGYTICAHPALKTELGLKWPSAKFVFSGSGGFYGVLDDYDANKCDVMAIGIEDTRTDGELMEMFCERNLVYTESLITETPIAFPIHPKLASGLSYWIIEGEKHHDISIENVKAKYIKPASCNVEFAAGEEDTGDYAQISPANMFFPIMVFTVCALTAIVLRLLRQRRKWKEMKKKMRSSIRGASHGMSYEEGSAKDGTNSVTDFGVIMPDVVITNGQDSTTNDGTISNRNARVCLAAGENIEASAKPGRVSFAAGDSMEANLEPNRVSFSVDQGHEAYGESRHVPVSVDRSRMEFIAYRVGKVAEAEFLRLTNEVGEKEN